MRCPQKKITMTKKNKLIKCYVFDFGDTPLITEDLKIIMDWLEADVSGIKKDGEAYESTITIRYMTRKEIDDLPEWS